MDKLGRGIVSIGFMLMLFVSHVVAVPARPAPIDIQQPDGTMLTIKLVGDEREHWTTTTDGYQIMRNKSGVYEYTGFLKSGKVVSSGVKVNNVDSRSGNEVDYLKNKSKTILRTGTSNAVLPASSVLKSGSAIASGFPNKGSRKFLMILANFSDTQTSYTQTNFDNLMNETGYNGTGSFKDFYFENSNGLLTITTTVTQWVTVPKTHDYYGVEANWSEFVMDAVKAADAAGLDFSQFDNDGDKVVESIGVIHQGTGKEVSGKDTDIWSHSYNLGKYSAAARTFDGVKVMDYTCQPEIYTTQGLMSPIGIICHEFGHALGVPDFYDTADYASNDGTGKWDLMSIGSYNGVNGIEGCLPAHFNPYLKVYLGWMTVNQLTSPQAITQVPTVTGTTIPYAVNTEILKVNSYTPGEYFLLETKALNGFDKGLPGAGLLIYRVNENQINENWDKNRVNVGGNQGLYPVVAGTGINTASCLFPYLTKTSFTDDSTPNSLDLGGNTTSKSITNIMRSGANIKFDFMSQQIGVPQMFKVVANSSNQIDLSWQAAVENYPVLICWSADGVFGKPIDGLTYSQGQTVTGGGTVLYYGSASNAFQHSGLTEKKSYYYRIYSNTGTSYSNYLGRVIKTLVAPVTNYPWYEGFESNLDNWAQETVVGERVNWKLFKGGEGSTEFVPVAAQEGMNNALFFSVEAGKSTRLVSPLFVASAGKTYHWTFYHAQAGWKSQDGTYTDQDELKVLYKKDADATWTVLESFTKDVPAWTKRDYSFTATGDFRLAFEAVGNYGHGVAIDRVMVEENVYVVTFTIKEGALFLQGAAVTFNGQTLTTGVDGKAVFQGVGAGTGKAYTVVKTGYYTVYGSLDVAAAVSKSVSMSLSTQVEVVQEQVFRVTPNPTQGFLMVSLPSKESSKYFLYNLSGDVIASGVWKGSAVDMNISAYASGIYLLKVQQGTVVYHSKVILRK